MRQLNHAYDVLSDPDRRREYDELRAINRLKIVAKVPSNEMGSSERAYPIPTVRSDVDTKMSWAQALKQIIIVAVLWFLFLPLIVWFFQVLSGSPLSKFWGL